MLPSLLEKGDKLKNELHKLEDFLNDSHFRDWILNEQPDPQNPYWKQWLEDNPDKASLFRRAVQVLETLRDQSVPWAEESKAQILERIQSAIRQGENSSNESVPLFPDQRRRPFRWYKAAAAILILLSSAALWQMDIFNGNPSPDITNNNRITRATAGQRSTIYLPDGSIVFLNAGSQLQYDSSAFEGTSREVFLTGEAFFQVHKNPGKPFRVHSNGLITTALGTSFNVRTYTGLPSKIQLASGKVRVDKTGVGRQTEESIVLEPGQEAIVGKDGRLHLQEIPVDHIDAWRTGALLFDRTPFDEAVKTLEIWYGKEIVVKGMKNIQPLINGRFDNEQLDKILESMQFSLGFNYTIEEKHVIIEFY